MYWYLAVALIIAYLVLIVFSTIKIRLWSRLASGKEPKDKLIFNRREGILMIALLVLLYVFAFSLFYLMAKESGDSVAECIRFGLLFCGLYTIKIPNSIFLAIIFFLFYQNWKRKKSLYVTSSTEKANIQTEDEGFGG